MRISRPASLLLTLSAVAFGLMLFTGSAAAEEKVPKALDFTMKTLDGKEVKLADRYKGKVVLVVNVASQCGLTPQYRQLQGLHEKYEEQGLKVVGFPCNQFGAQEPGTASEIRTFCTKNYGVEFDLFSKVDVNGEGACPLYQYLTELKTDPKGPGKVSWNFEKFLLNRNGEVIARFSPRTRPDAEEVVSRIEAELKAAGSE
ncbi:MAG: glutathione peroxidase [Planctomycetaceae bacterium]|nr:glutathione peroxidase [Planctomycetaceae bacterium]